MMNKPLQTSLTWLAVFALLLPLLAFAGTTGKIVGKVKDDRTGETLPGVNVVLEGTMLGAVTDYDGDLMIINAPPGTHTMQVKMIGYDQIHLVGRVASAVFDVGSVLLVFFIGRRLFDSRTGG